MKTLEQLAREAGMTPDVVMRMPWLMLEFLPRFRAACRAEALEEASVRLLDIAAKQLTHGRKFALQDAAAAIREMK